MSQHGSRNRGNARPFTLMPGGGGVPGVAFQVGVLRALEEVARISANDAETTIGTSARGLAGM